MSPRYMRVSVAATCVLPCSVSSLPYCQYMALGVKTCLSPSELSHALSKINSVPGDVVPYSGASSYPRPQR